jgi:lysophospholipase L1-like esterase
MIRHSLIISVFLFLAVLTCQGQVKTDYPFIKRSFNRLSYSADSSAFMNVFKKIRRIEARETEQLRIVHLGGSHVQAGLWSATFLDALQQKYNTTGGGYFVFPYRIGKTNGQPYASTFSDGKWKLCRSIGKEFCQPLGMSGLSVKSNDSTNHFGAMFTKKASCTSVNRVLVYHNFNPSFSFDLCNRDSLKIKRNDQPDKGYSEYTFDIPVDSVCFTLTRLDTLQPDFILFGFSLENNMSPGFYLAALGANGASTSSFLKADQLARQLESLKADLYILSLGVNDTQSKGYEKEDFVENYDTLINLIRKATPDAAILLTTTTDNYIRRKTSNKRTISAKEGMFQLLDTHALAVWDLFSVMGGYKSMSTWYRHGFAAKDKVHFNGRGYTVVGTLMFDAFIKASEGSKEKNDQ